MKRRCAQEDIKIEFETSVFLKALELANEVYPREYLSINHPAHIYLSNVWNTHPNVPTEFKHASIAKIHIRIDKEYVSVDCEEPQYPVVDLSQKQIECSAKIGNDILIIFFKKPYNFKTSEKEMGWNYANGVNGSEGWIFSGTLEEVDFGYGEIDGLKRFKKDYPKIYKKLQNSANIEVSYAKKFKSIISSYLFQ